MNQSEIFELAKEVGLIDSNAFSKAVVRHSNGSWVDVADDLEEFAKQVAAKEHKAYGKALERIESELMDLQHFFNRNAKHFAAANMGRVVEMVMNLVEAHKNQSK